MASFKMHEIRELIRLVDESGLEELELEREGDKLKIKKASGQQMMSPVVIPPSATPPPVEPVLDAPRVEQVTPPKKNFHAILSPMVGTFYRAPSPEAEVYVKEGDTVTEKTVVCIVEAMKLMNEIEAEVKGTVVEVLVENGQLVEYGQPLFHVQTT